MFIGLLAATTVTSIVVSFITVMVFENAVSRILSRIIDDEISLEWVKYLKFAIYVVGVSGGVGIWNLEKYITSMMRDTEPVIITGERWVLEIYRTVIGSLQGIAWMLLVFFVFALIAYVIIRCFETKGRKKDGKK